MKNILFVIYYFSVNVFIFHFYLFPLFLFINRAAAVSERLFCDAHVKTETYVKSLADGDDYDREIPPTAGGMPVVVSLEMHVQQLSDLSTTSGDLEMELFFTEIWDDKRMKFEHMDACRQNVTLDKEFEEKIWSPKICATNSKLAISHHSPAPNEFLTIYANGTVWRNHRMKLRAPCVFQIARYPFDSVSCSLKFGSFSYQADEVRMAWMSTNSVTMMGPFRLPDFSFIDYALSMDDYGYYNSSWHRLEIAFRLRRRVGHHIFQLYLPTAATVSISWISFCLEERSTSARVSVGVSALLALSFQLGSDSDRLPHASQLKALDIWTLMCISFVCLSLLQSVLVARIGRWQRRENLKHITVSTLTDILRERRKSLAENAAAAGKTSQPAVVIRWPISCADKLRRRRSAQMARPRYWWLSKVTTNRIDKACLYVIPAAFGIFNLAYWTYYGGLYLGFF